MASQGLRHAERTAALCLLLVAAGGGAVWWGAAEMRRLGGESGATAAAIGAGLLLLLTGVPLLANFLWGVRVVRAMRRGEGLLAHWQLDAAAVEHFRRVDEARARAGARNEYRLPSRLPADGLAVRFSEHAVLVHDTFFGLANAGVSRFRAVRLVSGQSPCLEFDLRITSAINSTHANFFDVDSTLRVPVSADAGEAARRVLAHYQAVAQGDRVVRPNFWRVRKRIGMATAGLAALTAGGGFALNAAGAPLGNVPLVMAVGGVVLALAGLLLALFAHVRAQRVAS